MIKKMTAIIKIFTLVFMLLIVASGKLMGQETEVIWSDSHPFDSTSTTPNSGILIDSLVTLTPLVTSVGQNTRLNVKLDGTIWNWPKNTIELENVEDIDRRTVGGQDIYLITERGGRLVEYNTFLQKKVWEFEDQLVLPVDAYVFFADNQDQILVTDKGNNKVIQFGHTTLSPRWEYGDENGLEGNGDNQLSGPSDAMKIPNSKEYIIADRGNNRVIIVDSTSHTRVWELGSDILNSPVDVEYMQPTSQILITDQGNNRVILVQRSTKEIVWEFGRSDGQPDSLKEGLNQPVDADYLENGHILIADAGNKRIIEVDPNSNYFWQYKRPLELLRDVDQINTNDPANTNLLVVHKIPEFNEVLPSRLGFKSAWVESKIIDVGQEVNFSRIFWDADVIADTTFVHFQFRSGIDDNSLQRSPWYGPKSDTSKTYDSSGSVLSDIHKGHNLYQYRVLLETNNPKETPVLKNVSFDYFYYQSDIVPKPVFFTGAIGINDDRPVVPKWKQLIYEQVLPTDPTQRGDIQLLFRIVENQQPYLTLYEFLATTVSKRDTIELESIDRLRGVKSIFLNGFPSTNNSALSPALVSWKVIYDEINTTESSLQFVKATGQNAVAYLATTTYPPEDETEIVDMMYVNLNDDDLEALQSTVELTVQATKSRDSEDIELFLQLPNFKTLDGIPMVISETAISNNDTLEVFDRDSLVITYQDKTDPTDFSKASILVVQATRGRLQIESEIGQPLTEVNFGDQLYVHVFEEGDKNLDPVNQDVLKLVLKNNATIDEEKVTLYEVADENGHFNTGEFRSRTAIVVVENNNGVPNDEQLQSLAGHRITAEYVDNVTLTYSVLLPDQPTIFIDLGGEPYVVEVAPNPYYESAAKPFRLRLASATGSLIVRFIEVFNLAGEKVREINGAALQFTTGTPVPKDRYGIADDWWDLKSDSGHKISSGTYFLKVHADLIQSNTNQLESIAIFRKFVVVN